MKIKFFKPIQHIYTFLGFPWDSKKNQRTVGRNLHPKTCIHRGSPMVHPIASKMSVLTIPEDIAWSLIIHSLLFSGLLDCWIVFKVFDLKKKSTKTIKQKHFESNWEFVIIYRLGIFQRPSTLWFLQKTAGDRSVRSGAHDQLETGGSQHPMLQIG